MEGYTTLASYYDRFVGADYEQIVGFICNKLKAYGNDPSLICDVGCGSGSVTLALLQKGFDMIGIDGSFEMLNEALIKRDSMDNGDRALFLCQQLPEFELFGTVDAIISTLDTINYITDEQDLDRLFYWYRNYLNPDGLLIFDVNSLYKFQEILNNNCDIYEDENVFLCWRSNFDGKICDHALSFFERDGDCYFRTDEEQKQRYYSIDEIKAFLAKYQFDLLELKDGYTNQEPTDESERLTFVARVRKENIE